MYIRIRLPLSHSPSHCSHQVDPEQTLGQPLYPTLPDIIVLAKRLLQPCETAGQVIS